MMRALMQYPGLGIPSERRPEPPLRDSKLEEALRQYRHFCADTETKKFRCDDERFNLNARELITAVLDPLEISLFLAKIIPGREHPRAKSSALNVLISNTYATGIPSFDITIPDNLEIDGFGSHLCGTREQPYNIRITGNLRYNSFCESKHVNVIVNGTCGHEPAISTEHVNLEFEEPLNCVGYSAKDSTFIFRHINHKPPPANATIIPDLLVHAIRCKIQFYDLAGFNLLNRVYIKKFSGNKIQLIKKGTHEVIQEVSV